MSRPGEHSLAEFAADHRPRIIVCADLVVPSRDGGEHRIPCAILNTPALRVVLAQNGL